MLNSFTFYLWYNSFHDIYYDIYSYDIFREQIFNTILIWVIIWWQSRLKKNTFFQQHRSVSKTNVKLIRKIHLNFKLSYDYKWTVFFFFFY